MRLKAVRSKVEFRMAKGSGAMAIGVAKMRGAKREAVLDAAESLVMIRGAAHLTMDAVAARAGVSKGGVLHHFPTKSDLINGMLERLLATFRSDMDAIERLAGPGLKEHLQAWIRLTRTTNEKLDRVTAALLSASANEPRLLAPFAEMMQDRIGRYRENNPEFGLTLVILTALDGYWLFNSLGLEPVTRADSDSFFDALNLLVERL
jgi:AcrR family transcriptional regulator